MEHNTYKLVIKGTVQGVGFRPFIFKLAKDFNLSGYVLNSGSGVEVVINCKKDCIDIFTEKIEQNKPPLSKIDSISVNQIDKQNFTNFTIKNSTNKSDLVANIPPDISICKECEAELFDPNNRRYLYPFITCTNCGVRYSIIYNLPYDRKNTSMKFFKMCKACKEEFTNPLNRRYHAQPIGCFECGPKLELYDNLGKILLNSTIKDIVELILQGNILAIKGVGGYHLICDATNKEAIDRLRERKRRPSKPFAVMVKDITTAKNIAHINKKEEELLSSKERPIVICKLKDNTLLAKQNISPNISKIGLFLPYTPLHILILNELNRPIVATSANLSDEPIATNFKTISKLSSIYDYLLDHNREIVNGCDDSVLMVVKDRVMTIRRARGYTPCEIELPFNLNTPTLALGANQKSTIAIGFANKAILSPHIGDLNSISSIEYYKKNIDNLTRIYNFKPKLVAFDLHPNYESTHYAKTLLAKSNSLKSKRVQHHFAHILGVMAEYKIDSKVLGVAFDGTGLGDDGKLWGGEFLECSYSGYKRVAHFKYFKLLGGERAIKEPRRVALSLLFEIYGKEAIGLDNSCVKSFTKKELNNLYKMWKKGLNAPLSSSVGRLFDAVASIVNICQIMSFEGESGMLLEELYSKEINKIYPYTIKNREIDILPMVKEIIKEPKKEVAVTAFFNTLVDIIATIYKDYNLPLILSGGVFQNKVLVELILNKLPNAILPKNLPPNDGGIALGEIVSLYQLQRDLL